MKIQIKWAKAYQISAGVQKDFLSVTLRDNEHFSAVRTFKKIPVGSNDLIKVPTMMPNDELTKDYTSTSDVVK